MARVIHFEIVAKDPQRAAEFYRDALGWESQTWPSGDQTYWLMTTGPEGTAGINGGIMGPHLPQTVINTVEVPSLEEATERITKHGGKRVHGPNEIPGIGLHSYFADPEGTLFGVLQPAPKT